MWPVCLEAAIWRIFSCFWIEWPLIMAEVIGGSYESVVKLRMEGIFAHLQLLLGQKDVWYYIQVNLENWVCASFCLTWHILGSDGCDNCCLCSWKKWVITVPLNCCWSTVLLLSITLSGCSTLQQNKKQKKNKLKAKSVGWIVLKLQAFNRRCISTTHASNTWHWALRQYWTPNTERVKQLSD